jgi:hypothetical protein
VLFQYGQDEQTLIVLNIGVVRTDPLHSRYGPELERRAGGDDVVRRAAGAVGA